MATLGPPLPHPTRPLGPHPHRACSVQFSGAASESRVQVALSFWLGHWTLGLGFPIYEVDRAFLVVAFGVLLVSLS